MYQKKTGVATINISSSRLQSKGNSSGQRGPLQHWLLHKALAKMKFLVGRGRNHSERPSSPHPLSPISAAPEPSGTAWLSLPASGPSSSLYSPPSSLPISMSFWGKTTPRHQWPCWKNCPQSRITPSSSGPHSQLCSTTLCSWGSTPVLLRMWGKNPLTSILRPPHPPHISTKRNYIGGKKPLKTKWSCPEERVLDYVFCFYDLGRIWLKQAPGGVRVYG